MMSSAETYKYTNLKDVTLKSVHNIIGVIKYARQSLPKREHHVFLSITDESIFSTKTSKISTNAFVINSTDLDEVRAHRIVRIHRLRFESFQGTMQGISRAGCHFVVFDESPGASLEPLYSSSPKHSPVTDAEAKRIEELRLWLQENMKLFERCEDNSPVNFSDVEPGQFFTNFCQVLSHKYNDDLRTYILHVTDGTPLKRKLHRLISLNEVVDPNVWNCPLSDLEPIVIEIQVMRSHAECLGRLKAGDFLRVKNLHVFFHCDEEDDQDREVAFQLHKGLDLLQKVPPMSFEAREIDSRLKPLRRSGAEGSKGNFHDGIPGFDDDRNLNFSNNLQTSRRTPSGPSAPLPPRSRQSGSDVSPDLLVLKLSAMRSNVNNNSGKAAACRDDDCVPAKDVALGINHVLIREDVVELSGDDANGGASHKSGQKYAKSKQREFKRKSIRDWNDHAPPSKRVKWAELETHLPPVDDQEKSVVDGWTQTDCVFRKTDYVFWSSSDSSEDDDDDGRGIYSDDNTGKNKDARNQKQRSDERPTASSQRRPLKDYDVVDGDSIRRQWDGIVVSLDSSMSCDEDDVYYRQESQGYAGRTRRNGLGSTLTTCHESRETCTLDDVAGTFPPMNFKVRAKVEDYFPKPDLNSPFVQLHCSVCDFLLRLRCRLSTDKNPDKKCSWNCKQGCSQVDVRHRSPCPRCKSRGRTAQMRHVFTFQILMVDCNTGTTLCLNLWGNEANKLLGKPGPKSAVSIKSKMKELKEKMDGIVGSSVDCCISSSSQNGGVFYQIFDTFLTSRK